MEQIYDSRHSGQEVDNAVDAVQTTIPNQLTQIGSNLDEVEAEIGKIEEFSFSAAGEKEYRFVEGNTYIVTNIGSSSFTISIRETKNGEGHDATNVGVGKSVEITASIDGYWVRVGTSCAFSITLKGNINSRLNAVEANLQRVDDEPTVGSDNLVKSGGVAESIFDSVKTLVNEGVVKYSYIHNYNKSAQYQIYKGRLYKQFKITISATVGDGFTIRATNSNTGTLTKLATLSPNDTGTWEIFNTLPQYEFENLIVVSNSANIGGTISLNIECYSNGALNTLEDKVIELKYVNSQSIISNLQIGEYGYNTTNNKVVKKVSDSSYFLFDSYDKTIFLYEDKLYKISSNGVFIAINEEKQDIDIPADYVIDDLTSNINFIVHKFSSFTIDQPVTVTSESAGGFRGYYSKIFKGDIISITGTGGSSARLFGITDSDGILKLVADKDVSESNYKLVSPCNGKLYCNFNAGYTYSLKIARPSNRVIINYNSTINLIKAVTFPYNSEGIKGNIGDTLIPTKKENPAWRSIGLKVKAGDVLDITAKGGNSSVAFFYIDNNKKLLKIADGDKQVVDYLLEAWVDGTVFINADLNFPININVIKKTESKDNYHIDCIQFGFNCDCDFSIESVPALSLPDIGSRQTYFYGLYNALQESFPTYITKVDCDEELHLKGIIRPEELSDYHTYMYKFIPSYTPSTEALNGSESVARKFKVFITTGTHPEYAAIWDLYYTLKLICEQWSTDRHLEELRWNCEFYILPLACPWNDENGSRTNINGIDPNRNMPTANWCKTVEGSLSYGGSEPGSEYESKLLVYYLNDIKPDIYIDHHNSNTGAGTTIGNGGKNFIYTESFHPWIVDVSCAHISQMTRKWKTRSHNGDILFENIFPSNDDNPNVMFGFSRAQIQTGTRELYAADLGINSCTYETCNSLLWKNGEIAAENRQMFTSLVSTCCVEAFINFLVRLLKTYSNRL